MFREAAMSFDPCLTFLERKLDDVALFDHHNSLFLAGRME
jgi:hypothetical protein